MMKHGGRRAGAGRPAKLVNPVVKNYRVEEEQAQWVEAWASDVGMTASEAIRELLDMAAWLAERDELGRMLHRVRKDRAG